MQSFDSIETYAYGTSKDLVCKKEEIKCSNIIKWYKQWLILMVLQKKTKEHNPNSSQIPDHPQKMLIIGGSGWGKTNSWFNLIKDEPDFDKIYLYAKDPYEAKYQSLINKGESIGLKNFNDSKAFSEYSNDMDDIYKIIEEYNPDKKPEILIVFDDIIADMLSNKKLYPIVTELFIRGRKLNISFVFITQSYFAAPKNY